MLQVGCGLTLAQQKERKTTMPEFQTQFNKISDNIQLQVGFQYPNKSGFRFIVRIEFSPLRLSDVSNGD